MISRSTLVSNVSAAPLWSRRCRRSSVLPTIERRWSDATRWRWRWQWRGKRRRSRRRTRRSARIVGGGSQRGPTQRRQQAESLAHSFSVPLARSGLLSSSHFLPLLSFSVSLRLPFAFSLFPVLLSADPLFIRLSFVVPYGCSAHPPVVAHSNVWTCILHVCICTHMHLYVCMRGDAGSDQESQVYGTHWPPRESFPVLRRRPFTGVDLQETRPPNFFSFCHPLASDWSSRAPLLRRVVLFATSVHGVSPVCRWTRCCSCPPGGMPSPCQNHGNHPRASCMGGN